MLNHKIEVVASLMRIAPRSALWYAPEDTAPTVADDIERAVSAKGT